MQEYQGCNNILHFSITGIMHPTCCWFQRCRPQGATLLRAVTKIPKQKYFWVLSMYAVEYTFISTLRVHGKQHGMQHGMQHTAQTIASKLCWKASRLPSAACIRRHHTQSIKIQMSVDGNQAVELSHTVTKLVYLFSFVPFLASDSESLHIFQAE